MGPARVALRQNGRADALTNCVAFNFESISELGAPMQISSSC
jgi:hypothetical protein